MTYKKAMYSLIMLFGCLFTPLEVKAVEEKTVALVVESTVEDDGIVQYWLSHLKSMYRVQLYESLDALPENWTEEAVVVLSLKKESTALQPVYTSLRTEQIPTIWFGYVPESSEMKTKETLDVRTVENVSLEEVIEVPLLKGAHQQLIEACSFDRCTPFVAKKDSFTWIGSAEPHLPLVEMYGSIIENLIEKQTFNRTTYLHIGKVTPSSDVSRLKRTVSYLRKQNIPYTLIVQPIEQLGEQEKRLAEVPELVHLLRTLQREGARIVMSGDEQQEKSPFWNIQDDESWVMTDAKAQGVLLDEAIIYDSNNPTNDFVRDEEKRTEMLIQKGLYELVSESLYPVAFYTAHGAMSPVSYDVVSRYFTWMIGSIQWSSETFYSQWPFRTPVIAPFTKNLTVLPITHDANEIEQNDFTLYETDRVVSVLFDISRDVPIEKIIERIERVPYSSWGKYELFSPRVDSSFYQLTALDPFTYEVQISPINRLQHAWEVEKANVLLWSLAIVVALFVTAFLFYIYKMRHQLRYRLFDERKEK